MSTLTLTPTLVLGANGKTGSRVAQRLADRGRPVRGGSRTGSPPFDWLNPDTWPAALDGVRTAYVTYQPDIAAPGALGIVSAFFEHAVEQGVRRLVLLSGRGEREARRAEQVLQQSGLDWTIVRASWFSQNFSEGFLLDQVRAGEIALPANGTTEPFIDVEDIADVAVEALVDDSHAGRLYEVTGPRLLSFAQAAGELAAATGREIRYLPVTVADFRDGALAAGAPADLVDLLAYLFGEVLDGRNAHLADGVQRALGREPRDFADHARRTAATGVWSDASRPAGGSHQ